MADFYYNVDTSPMAESIDGVNNNVKVVGAAVTAMQAAVIASERKATEKICNSVNQGFFMLLRSRISQRMSEFSSTMRSRTGSMLETASSIDHTHQQMLEDFNRIKARYMKLFNRLDRGLESRVRELDRPAMEIARHRQTFLSERRCREIPIVYYCGDDASQLALSLANARVKTHTKDSISQLGAGARQLLQYEQATQSVFENASQEESLFAYIPVVYSVTESQLVPQSFSLDIHTPENLDPATQASIAVGVRQGQMSLTGASASELDAIKTLYMEKVSASSFSERVTQTMVALYNQSFGG